MYLGEPPRSQYDLHFRLFGIPIRIHPWFWLITLLLGISGKDTPPVEVLLWIVAVTISIIIHELGHAFIQRHFGGRPRIVLYSLGGLAICEDCDRDTRSQILIALAGPFAGFAFALLILLFVTFTGEGLAIALGNRLVYESGNTQGAMGTSILGVGIYWQQTANPLLQTTVLNLLWINILWGIVNLLPVYPLDGGRVSREVCQIGNPRGGIILSLQISIAVAIGMAIFGFVVWGSLYTALMFGFLAYSSFQTLQAYRQHLW
jgi:stage IV sporulation protein FB